MTIRIAAGFVTYNPDLELFETALKSAISEFDTVLVVDNGSTNIRDIRDLQTCLYFHLIEFEENKGLPKALNYMLKFADNHSIPWFVTLDQDSIVSLGYYEAACDVIKLHSDETRLAIVCPKIIDRNSGRVQNNNAGYLRRCITSGSVTNVSAWKEIRGFDESLFIDEVDHDFCWRLIDSGWKIYCCPNCEISHAMGNIETRSFLGRDIYVRNYTPSRRFYQMRNYIYCRKKNGDKSVLNYITRLVTWIALIALFEDQRIEKIKSLFVGFYEGMRYKKIAG